MKRSDLSPSGSITELAQEVCGLVPEQKDSAYEAQAEYASRLESAAAR